MQCNGYSPHLGCGIGVQFAHLPLRISYSLILYFNKLIKLGGNIMKVNKNRMRYYAYIIYTPNSVISSDTELTEELFICYTDALEAALVITLNVLQ